MTFLKISSHVFLTSSLISCNNSYFMVSKSVFAMFASVYNNFHFLLVFDSPSNFSNLISSSFILISPAVMTEVSYGIDRSSSPFATRNFAKEAIFCLIAFLSKSSSFFSRPSTVSLDSLNALLYLSSSFLNLFSFSLISSNDSSFNKPCTIVFPSLAISAICEPASVSSKSASFFNPFFIRCKYYICFFNLFFRNFFCGINTIF